MAQKRKMQAGLAARGEHHESWRTHTDLSDVQHAEARPTMRLCRDHAALLDNCAFEKLIELRSRNSPSARFVGTHSQWQQLLNALAFQRRDRNYRSPAQKFHLLANLPFERRARSSVFPGQQIPLVKRQDDRAA